MRRVDVKWADGKMSGNLAGIIERGALVPKVVDVRVVVEVPSGLDADDVAQYVREAVDGYSGCFHGDDPRTKIKVKKLFKSKWVPVLPDDHHYHGGGDE